MEQELRKKVEKVKKLHRSGYGCAQAIYCGFGDLIGISESEAARIAGPYSGGRKGKCGAVLAAELFLKNKFENPKQEDEFERKFIQMNQSAICQELRGKRLRSCAGCVEDAAVLLAEMISEEGKIQ